MFSNSARKKVKYTRYFYCNMLRRHFPPFDVTSRVLHIDRNYVNLFYILLFLFTFIMFSTTPWLTLRKNTSYILYSHVIILITTNYPLFIIFDESSYDLKNIKVKINNNSFVFEYSFNIFQLLSKSE